MEPFIAEIRIFPLSYAPQGWASCDGQLLPVRQNSTLFSVLGPTYGGDGFNDFALPDLRGRAPMHAGQGSLLTPRKPGDKGGTETVTLTETQMPAHLHQIGASSEPAEVTSPENNTIAVSPQGRVYHAGPPNRIMSPQSLAAVGANSPHNNMQPYLTTNFCIALTGVYPRVSQSTDSPI